MPAKQSKSANREQLVDDLHKAARAYIEGGNGKVMEIGRLEIVPHKGMEFDIVIKCVGKRPVWP
jgi:hypothetical protein